MKRLCLFIIVTLNSLVVAERNAYEEGLVEWSKSRDTVLVNGRSWSSAESLASYATNTRSNFEKVYDFSRKLSMGMGQKALRDVENYAVAKAASGDRELAVALGKAMNEARIDWLRHVTDETWDQGRYTTLLDTLDRFEVYSLAQRIKSAELMLESSLLFKGYAVDMSLAAQRKWAHFSVEERKQAKEIQKLEKRLNHLNKIHWLADERREEFEKAFGKEIKQLQAQLEQYGDVVVREKLVAPQTAYGLLPTLTEVRNLIDKDTLVIDVVLARSLEQRPYSIPTSKKEVYIATAFDREKTYGPYVVGEASKIDKLVDNITLGLKDEEGATEEHLLANSGYLREKLLNTFLKESPNKKRLLLSMSGKLQFAPIPMLPDQDGSFLVQKYEVGFFDSYRQLVNGSSWRSLKPAENSLLMGDPTYLSDSMKKQLGEKGSKPILSPLSGTRKEIETAREVLKIQGEQSDTYLGKDATEGAFYASLQKPAKYLHFATHGCFFSPSEKVSDPMDLAALTLVNAEDTLRKKGVPSVPDRDDGLLQASEILRLNLRDTQLVILSACDTAVGEAQAGDLVLGFRGAFFVAGAPNVVLTLIPVSDALCPLLMTNFYVARASIDSESRAWTLAIRKLLKDPYLKDPVRAMQMVGPFVLVNNQPEGFRDWPVAPIRGFMEWRRPLSVSKYVNALSSDPKAGLYLTKDFRKRLAAIDAPNLGMIPTSATIHRVERDGDEAYVKVTSRYRKSMFVVVKEKGKWLIDDIIETYPQ